MHPRAVMDRLVNHIPGYVAWRLQRNLGVWQFSAGGESYEALVPDEWLTMMRNDDGTGTLTGFDRNGRYEAAFSDMFVAKLSAASVLLDVGANYGIYSVMAARFCAPGNIHCFEPARAPRSVLAANNRRYCAGQLNIVPCAVGSRESRDTTTLDAYCDRYGTRPTMVKLDIEGGEIHAIHGMRQICVRHRPVILLELHLRKMRELLRVDPRLMLDTLRDYGYRHRFNGHHWHLVLNRGEPDRGWHDELPNDVNCAVLAEPV